MVYLRGNLHFAGLPPQRKAMDLNVSNFVVMLLSILQPKTNDKTAAFCQPRLSNEAVCF